MATDSDEENNNKMTKRQKRLKCLSMDGQVNKKGYAHMVGYNSAFKRKEMLTQATTQMNLEDLRLSEIRQLPKDK